MPHLATYIGLGDHSEQTLTHSLRAVAEGHARQADAYHTCRLMASWSDDHRRTLAAVIARYGEQDDVDEPERLRAPPGWTRSGRVRSAYCATSKTFTCSRPSSKPHGPSSPKAGNAYATTSSSYVTPAVASSQLATLAGQLRNPPVELPAQLRATRRALLTKGPRTAYFFHADARPRKSLRWGGVAPVKVQPADWLLTKSERANPRTRLDARHRGEEAWSEGNLVRPLVHGRAYFAELYERIEATREGDLVYFTDWQGDADERLTGEPGSEVAEVLGSADERGVDVRGLVWRSHWEGLGFNARENRLLGEDLQRRGAEVLLDMRVRTGGSHHQKMVVIRHRGDPSRDVAYVGGIDLCHSRRDDADHHGDPQALRMAREYGATPPWHDIQAAISGPAVHDVETVFRERWEDPTPLSRNPLYRLQDRLRGADVSPDPLPEQAPPPPPVEGGPHVVQLLRTYPNLRHGRDYPFARGGERSVARGYSKALHRARRLVYVEDQYLWGHHVGDIFTEALREQPDLHVMAVIPIHPDQDARIGRTSQLVGRRRAILRMLDVAPDRVAVFGIENHAGTPIYVHAKTCIVDDTWTTIGSDNFNRRSWTHDSELSAVVLDAGPGDYALRLRLTLAGEHLDRPVDDLDDCVEPADMFATFIAAARRLDEWHADGRRGQRPPGRLRRLGPPALGPLARTLAMVPYLVLDDPDGRPRPLRRHGGF